MGCGTIHAPRPAPLRAPLALKLSCRAAALPPCLSPRHSPHHSPHQSPHQSPHASLPAVVDEGHVDRVVHLAVHEGLELLGGGHLLARDLGGEAARQRLVDDRARHLARDLTDALELREGAPRGDLLRRHRVDARDRRLVQHRVRDLAHARDRCGEAEPGEDVHVVALRGDEHLAVAVRVRREGRARGDDGRAAAPLVGLGGGALGLGGGVGHGHHDGARAVGAHVLDHLAGEEAGGLRGEAQEHARLELLHHLLHR
mmetsp:Transcript_31044/g.79268  ORF Transcript_31044/g.79268 Transcript_31044/m.79268 type:complete len:257 (-) Transcript_31044:1230-2000(-)